MPEPTDFQQSKFPIDHVIFNSGYFSIAWGTWEGRERCLGMRWNGDGTDAGYPKLFKRPVWFIIPQELTIPILKGLEHAESIDQDALAIVLQEIGR